MNRERRTSYLSSPGLPSLSIRALVYHQNTRIHVRLLGPCFKTGRMNPFRQHPFRAEGRLHAHTLHITAHTRWSRNAQHMLRKLTSPGAQIFLTPSVCSAPWAITLERTEIRTSHLPTADFHTDKVMLTISCRKCTNRAKHCTHARTFPPLT